MSKHEVQNLIFLTLRDRSNLKAKIWDTKIHIKHPETQEKQMTLDPASISQLQLHSISRVKPLQEVS